MQAITTMQDVLTVNEAIYHGHGQYTVTNRGTRTYWTIPVTKDAQYPGTGTVWAWKVDGKYFSRDEWAAEYLARRIAEKTTGERVINRERGNVPDICGIDGACCRIKGRNYFTALCDRCPIAEQIQAERDGVKLKYVGA